MIRLIPPVAVPVGVLDVASSLFETDIESPGALGTVLAHASGMPTGYLFGSGRAALCAYLQHLATVERREVIVPAYTCWSVPASVVRAGLRVRLVDVNPQTFDFEPQALADAITKETVAVVAAHLLAPSVNVARVVEIVRDRNPHTHVIEDAAQAWPDGSASPADAVLLSFGRGKPLALGSGGALLTRTSLDSDIAKRAGGGWSSAASLALTSVLARPAWYRIPDSMPFLGIGVTKYEPDFGTDSPFRAWQERLAWEQLERLPELIRRRSANAEQLAGRVEVVSGWEPAAPARAPGPLRLPLLARSRELRDRMLKALRRAGVSPSPMYPGPLTDIPELAPYVSNDEKSDYPGARRLAERLLTLPVYPTLKEREVEAIGDAFVRAAHAVAS